MVQKDNATDNANATTHAALGEETSKPKNKFSNIGGRKKSLSSKTPRRPGAKTLATTQAISLWHFYCNTLTICVPPCIMRLCGMKDRPRQQAWREKIGLLSVILLVAAFVGFITFGFTRTVCSVGVRRFTPADINTGHVVIHGRVYDLTRSRHPRAYGIPDASNVLYPPTNAGSTDLSFMFQNVNGHCKGLFSKAPSSNVLSNADTGDLAWYFPCAMVQHGNNSLITTDAPYAGFACHTTDNARNAYASLDVAGEVFYEWDDIRNGDRNLAVWSSHVLDLDLLQWLDRNTVLYPSDFDNMRSGPRNAQVRGRDITYYLLRAGQEQYGQCLRELIKVGTVDTETVGCVASKVVLYISLVFILSTVLIKFSLALVFAWFLSPRLSAHRPAKSSNSKQREAAIEEWSDGIYKRARELPRARPASFMQTSRFSRAVSEGDLAKTFSASPRASMVHSPFRNSASFPRPASVISLQGMMSAGATAGEENSRSVSGQINGGLQGPTSPSFSPRTRALSPPATPRMRNFSPGITPRMRTLSPPTSIRSSMSNITSPRGPQHRAVDSNVGQPPTPRAEPIAQPPETYQPFNFPLAHMICMVTAYSEPEEGLRTTFDSLATTEYPNSHKLIIAVCDGMVQGEGSTATTPELVVGMMQGFVTPIHEIQAKSYIAVARGVKRTNTAKVYSGFYKYDSNTVETDRQQRVPMICIAKYGNPTERADGATKPGNRGKRDGQVMLMQFFQRVIYDERMTEFDYELAKSIKAITNLYPDMYEMLLMVDADTKIYPDSITYLVASMVRDVEIMGICGETKVANKSESWVTMIQVFEYYISHHLSKAFESVFGGVTCLPGCFSMYRITAPKGDDGTLVPILANPKVIEQYADNIVDTLHKKNLLLLGEDRYLSTLMLSTFPRRKNVFVPYAIAKTVVPISLSVLLSQRRRWINSTVHNLMELILVRDLCGTFCFSMQFVIFIELIGTVVLPAAICFTIYVIVLAITSTPTPVIPLILLAIILGLPGVLIVVTARRWNYLGYMLIYLLALPIWNFLLPVYAFWHFDDFTWGSTRKLHGEKRGNLLQKDGDFDSSGITMRTWFDWENGKMETLNVI